MTRISLGTNLFAEPPAPMAEELVQIMLQAPHVRIERIVSRGHRSQGDFWYDQETDEFVALLTGSAAIRFEGGREVVMRPGDSLTIAAHVRHQVAWTDPQQDTVWLTVHYRV